MNPIDLFLSNLPDPERNELERIRGIIRAEVPDAEEVISYGIPAFKYQDKYLIGFCAYKKHLSLFPTSGPIEEYKEQLGAYKLSRGTIQFTLSTQIPEKLIIQLVRSRLRDLV